MGEMKHTPEEIKKGLEMCAAEKGGCMGCPYRHDSMSGCITLKASDALAYIQQLEAQVPKWISVEERLPENDDDVLIMTPRYGVGIGYYAIYNNYWVDYVNMDNSRVTHWMPLLEPPKEE